LFKILGLERQMTVETGPAAKILSLPQRPEPPASEAELISRLDPRERQVLELLLKGYNKRQIAAELELAEGTVYKIIQRPAFQDAWNCWRPSTEEELDYKADRARERALDSRDDVLALRAAETHYKLRGKGGFGRADPGVDNDKVSAEDVAQALFVMSGGDMPQEGLSERSVAIAKDLIDGRRRVQDLYAREQALAAKEQDLCRREQAVVAREQSNREGIIIHPNGPAVAAGPRGTSGAIPDWA
jgi:hypothetical protein